jgi:hypothetical protein
MEYFIDKRVFVTGRKSVLSLDNPFNLTAFVNSQISLMGVSCAQNGLNIQAALDPITGTQLNCTELGGDLLRNTTVNGVGAFDMNFLEIFKYRLTIGEEMYLTIGSSQSTAGVGGVLTLLDASTGLCQWSTLPTTLTDNIYTVDGSLDSNRILDGAGTYNLSFIELNDFIVETVNSISFIEGDTFLIDDYTSFTISSVSIIDMEALTAVSLLTDGGLTLKGGTQLNIQTPSVGSGSPPSIGDVLTLSSVLGECEWQSLINVVNTTINYIANNKEVVLVTTGATDKDVTLPLAAQANQQITIKKIDAGAGVVHVLGNGVETIDGINDQPLNSQYNAMTVVSNGTEWFIISNF